MRGQVQLRHPEEPHLHRLHRRTLGPGGQRVSVAFTVLVQVALVALQSVVPGKSSSQGFSVS